MRFYKIFWTGWNRRGKMRIRLEALRMMMDNALRIMDKHIPIRLEGPTGKYDERDYIDLLVTAAILRTTPEKVWRLTAKRSSHRHTPSPDALFYHIKKLDTNDIIKFVEEMVDASIERARSLGFLKKPVDVAIDVHDWLYYGKKNDWVLGTKPRNGARYAFKYITASIVSGRAKLHVAVLPMKSYDDAKKLIVPILGRLRRELKIRIVYLDRHFYHIVVVEYLKRLRVKFVIQAPEVAEVKSALGGNTGKVRVVKGFRMSYGSGGLHVTSVNLFAVPSRHRKRKRVCFITNVDVDRDSARRLAELYRRRWNIETSYRMIKHTFLPRTASRSGIVRFFFFAFGVCLFNLYVLALLMLNRLSKHCSSYHVLCGLDFLFVISRNFDCLGGSLLGFLGFNGKCVEAKSTAPGDV